MCETQVYINKEGKEELLMENVVNVTPVQEGYKLTGLFGEEQTVSGRIKEIQLLEHKIILEG